MRVAILIGDDDDNDKMMNNDVANSQNSYRPVRGRTVME